MPTIRQLLKKKRTRVNKHKVADTAPQRKGVVEKASITSPKKPNSGQRKIARVIIKVRGRTNIVRKHGRIIMVKRQKRPAGAPIETRAVKVTIVGQTHGVLLAPHTAVLVRGGKTPDVNGIKGRIVPGALGCPGEAGAAPGHGKANQPTRAQGRSKFGAKKGKAGAKAK